MTFNLTIELGNDAMSNYGDVAKALRKVAAKISSYPYVTEDECKIIDDNGNTVGKWETISR